MDGKRDKPQGPDLDNALTKIYDIKKRIGKGAYGIVWKGIERKTGRLVAVKKIFDAFQNDTDAQRTFREIMFLRSFREHPNVVRLIQTHKALNDRDIYLVFEYMDMDLNNVIKKGDILKDVHKRFITYQLLKAIKYIHSGSVIHRDLKPSNVLLNSHCVCKVADFGLARSVSENHSGPVARVDPSLTDYVATRWYRAPEILIASKRYTKGVDMWSLGCILGEMLLGSPLFPGSSTVHQVELVMSSIQKPSPRDVEEVCGDCFGASLVQVPKDHRPLSEVLKDSQVEGSDLVRRLLVFNPLKRLTSAQALRHRYVVRFHDVKREPVLSSSIVPVLRDDVQLSVEEYRRTLYSSLEPRPQPKSTVSLWW